MHLEHRTAGTVLVIDDDQGMRQVLKDFLERDGHRVIEAASGEAAVSVVELEPIDVVILDKEMPGMNGMEVLSFLHRRFPSTPVILVTAFGGPHVAEESFRRGAVEYIEKPFRLSNVVDRVQKLIDDAP
jgi:DNA-binding NtrC family response regulator